MIHSPRNISGADLDFSQSNIVYSPRDSFRFSAIDLSDRKSIA